MLPCFQYPYKCQEPCFKENIVIRVKLGDFLQWPTLVHLSNSLHVHVLYSSSWVRAQSNLNNSYFFILHFSYHFQNVKILIICRTTSVVLGSFVLITTSRDASRSVETVAALQNDCAPSDGGDVKLHSYNHRAPP